MTSLITPLSKIQEVGACEVRKGTKDEKIIVLPSCTVPLELLDPANWKNPMQYGCFRSVLSIEEFERSEIRQALFAKSPERRLTTLRQYLDKGEIWWGGPKSTDRYAYKTFVGVPIIEDLGRWEAAFLTKLWKEDIPAEEPQAIIEYPDGRADFVVKAIPVPYTGADASELRTKSNVPVRDLGRLAKNLGFDPVDFQFVFDTHLGEDRIIDTARWRWPPFTDHTHQEILRILRNFAQDA